LFDKGINSILSLFQWETSALLCMPAGAYCGVSCRTWKPQI